MTERKAKRLSIKFKSISHLRLRALPLAKHYRASFGNESKRKILGPNRLKLSTRVKSVLSLAIIVIILVSVFAFMPKQNPSEPICASSTDSPTASPTAAPQSTSKPTPSDPFSQISRYMTGIGETIVQAVAPKPPGVIESNPSMNSTVMAKGGRECLAVFPA